MIKFADDSTKQQVWDMWKSVFGDSDDYMEIYFRTKYKNENTLLYFEGDKAVASLQMLPFQFTFCGTEIPALYLSGVSTLPEYRKKGYMDRLLHESFLVAHERGVPLMLLVPQEGWLLKFYDKYGFAQTFDPGTEEFTLLGGMKGLIKSDIHAAYKEFDNYFRKQDLTVQKTFEDFRAIAEEAKLFNYPAKKSLIGMARVIDAGKLLTIFASRHPEKEFSISIQDEMLKHNNIVGTVSEGNFEKSSSEKNVAFEADVRLLAQLLLGYHTSELNSPLNMIFPEKNAQMHYMME